MTTTQIFKESMRILLAHPTHFNSISMFLFSPLPISLFISHIVHDRFPNMPSPALAFMDHILGQNGNVSLYRSVCKTFIHIIICFPSSITFSLLGRAATILSVSSSYNRRIQLDRSSLLLKSGILWVKLIHTSFWEFLIGLGLFTFIITGLETLPEILGRLGICSRELGLWAVLGFLGVPFCVAFAHIMVVGNLARVLTVLENDQCYGFESLMKARNLIQGRRQTALLMSLMTSAGFRLVECMFEFRMHKGMSFWEGPVLVSMYSLLLVLDTVMNTVFYYTCK